MHVYMYIYIYAKYNNNNSCISVTNNIDTFNIKFTIVIKQ